MPTCWTDRVRRKPVIKTLLMKHMIAQELRYDAVLSGARLQTDRAILELAGVCSSSSVHDISLFLFDVLLKLENI
jgi:hypothetical protein